MEQLAKILQRQGQSLRHGTATLPKPTATTSIRGTYHLKPEELERHRDEIAAIEKAQSLCQGCDGKTCKQKTHGAVLVVTDKWGRYGEALRLCKYERQRREKSKISRLFSSACIPRVYERDTFADYTVTDENRDAVGAAKWVLAGKGGIYLYGARGTGKTKLAAIIANARISSARPVLFVSVPDLMADIRASFGGDKTAEVVEAVKESPFLVLDDLGAEKMTEWVGEQLFSIVNHRYNERLQTVVTSNYSPVEIIQHMATIDRTGKVLDDVQGQRIMSRIYGMCERVEIRGRDYRMKITGERSRG